MRNIDRKLIIDISIILLLLIMACLPGGFFHNWITDSHNVYSVKDCPKGQAVVLVTDKTYCAKPDTVITITTK